MSPAPTAPTSPSVNPLIRRRFTRKGTDVFSTLEYEKRSSKIINERGETIFELADAEVPTSWSQLATDIVVSKYFRKAGVPGTGHETSVRQVVYRIAHSIRVAGEEQGGLFDSKEQADTFEDELTHLLLHQKAAFNSPVWFNCGLYQEYQIVGGKGNWYWDPEKEQVVEADNNYLHPQSSACFIQAVNDDLMSMLDLMKSEARLFKYGSGTGSNFSAIRAKGEKLSGGGYSSGLLAFLKMYDSAAGAIKSGGTTRRAAKMVCLDMDHPEIADFINWKVNEEKKVAALVAAGYPADFNGEAYQTVTAQNANNSVRVTNQFMHAVLDDGEWNTYNRTDGKVAGTFRARELWDMLCQSAWQCADPGVQYDSIINDWHTCPNTDRIRASNPCSEYMFIDDTSCNLASVNLVKFLDEDGTFDVESYMHACRIMFIAQEILVDFASYPTRAIAQNSHDYRTLGLGYANLGTLLMRKGIPYDSPEAFAITAALTAIMTGHAYATSAEMAARRGPFNGYAPNRQPMLRVMGKHRDAAYQIDASVCPETLLATAQETWDTAIALGEEHGYRNAQATVIAPTGTIGLLMDCDTTSIEPDFALVKFKKLAGGGHFKIVNQSVPDALAHLGYSRPEIEDIIRYAIGTASLDGAPLINTASLLAKGILAEDLDKIQQQLPSTFDLRHAFNQFNISKSSLTGAGLSEDCFADPAFDFLTALGFTEDELEEANKVVCGMMTVEGAPHLKAEHLPVFDCANKCGKYGTRFIEPMGHLRIMAAAQPFISGAISKTVNLPHEASVEEISNIYFEGWRLGLKAVALYRDGSKLSQPLNSANGKDKDKENEAAEATATLPMEQMIVYKAERRRLPQERQAITHKFSIGGHEGYITVGMYPDGNPGEIFVTMAKQGSVISGLMDAFATSISLALQYNVPLEVLVNKFSHMRFEPSGMTTNPNIRIAKSVVDYLFRWMGMKFLDRHSMEQIGYNGMAKDQLGNGELNGTPTSVTVPVAVDSIQEKVDEGEETPPERDTEPLEVRVRSHRSERGSEATAAAVPAETNQTVHLTITGGEEAADRRSAQAESSRTLRFRFDTSSDAPSCAECGGMMVRNGSCYLCRDCGATSGCS
jgi:ribonucleoside-diphosphate reductase alpha chain